MKIVVTNWSGLNDGHIERLRKLGEVEVFTDTNNDNWARRLKGADVAVIDCFLTPVTKEILANLPDLKYFTINSTGYNKVDVEALKESNIIASNVPTFSTGSVAELAIGLMFAVVRKIPVGDKDFRSGFYEADPGTPEMYKYQGFNLEGKTLGVVGLGNIGTRIAEIGKGIGMNVVAYNRTEKNIPGVKMVALEQLMQESDIAIVALALNPETEGIISKDLISKLKNTAYIVSIAGVRLFDQEALKDALNNELIAGVGLDTAREGYAGVKNTVLTPHIGYDSVESMKNMADIIVQNIEAYANGNPINIIS